MATAGMPKRSSRLASREPVKAISERKLRSGKAININKSVQKVNIGTRNKKLRVSVKDAPQNNSPSLSKRLRPRKNKRNYCEDSKLLQLHIPSKQQKSMVVLEKLNLIDNKKVPVYKTIKPFEKSSEGKSDVYDFTFDSDNTEEKVVKKKQRKRNVNRAKGKVKKSVRKKVVIQSKPMTNETNKPPELGTKLSTKAAQNTSLEPAESLVTKSTKEKLFIKAAQNTSSEPAESIVTKSTKEKLSIKAAQNTSSEPAESTVTKSIKESIMEKPETPKINTDIQKLEESVEEDISISEAETLKINRDIQTAEKSIKEDVVKINETSGLNIASQIAEEWVNEDIMGMETFKNDTNIPTTRDTTSADKTLVNQDTSKPRITSIENADNIIITKFSPRNNEDLQPFRPKNISNNKTPMKESTNTLNYSLLTKSLSPILKTTNTLNTESPWCPTISMFSGTKHFLQSTPNTNFKMHKQKMEKNKENVEMDKENVDINKKNKCINRKERKKKAVSIYKKHILPKKFPMNQISENVQTTCVDNPDVKPVPARMLFGEIKNLLQTNNTNKDKQMKPDVNQDGKQTTHAEADILATKKNKSLVDLANFSDTFDVMSETERISNVGIDVPLFVDLEPSHFVEPPQHSYKRRRGVRFDFSQESCEEEEKEENKLHAKKKKKKLTKSEKEHTKRVDDWVKSINSTFEEIDKYDLFVE